MATPVRPVHAGITCRAPVIADAAAVFALVGASPPLERNSLYAYLLLTTHFANTSAVATDAGHCVGFLAAYRRPDDPSVLFVWQVAVDARMRGRGVARRLLADVLTRPGMDAVRYVEATVTPDNRPSRRLFEALAADRGVSLQESIAFTPSDFGPTGHLAEHLLRVGPFS